MTMCCHCSTRAAMWVSHSSDGPSAPVCRECLRTVLDMFDHTHPHDDVNEVVSG